jgi:hypothetical protein
MQLDKVINKAYTAFWTCRGSFRTTWGLKSRVVYRLYTMEVRPIIMYVTMLWWPRVKYKTSRAQLSKLQQLAYLGTKGTMKMAPTAASEVLLGLPLLHLKLEAKAEAQTGTTGTAAMNNGSPAPYSTGMLVKSRT